MSRFSGTLLPNFPNIESPGFANESENETRKMGLDLLNKINTVSDDIPTVPTTNYGIVMEWQPVITSNLTIGPTSSAASFSTVTIYAGVSVTIVSPAKWIIEATVGEIYDTGTNANGTYVKYSNGVMVCWGVIPEVTTSGGGPWATSPFYALAAMTLPAAYIDTTFAWSGVPGSGAYDWIAFASARSTTAINVYIFNAVNALVPVGSWQSIGFWR